MTLDPEVSDLMAETVLSIHHFHLNTRNMYVISHQPLSQKYFRNPNLVFEHHHLHAQPQLSNPLRDLACLSTSSCGFSSHTLSAKLYAVMRVSHSPNLHLAILLSTPGLLLVPTPNPYMIERSYIHVLATSSFLRNEVTFSCCCFSFRIQLAVVDEQLR